jgi:hypothetical protein
VLLAGGAAYALGAAATRVFTLPADVVTAIPIVALAVLVVVRWPWRPQPLVLPLPETRDSGTPPRSGHPFRAWAVLFAVVVAWELVEYLASGSRGEHPTLSSIADAADRSYVLKAAVFFGWLCLGACILRRGARALPGAEGSTRPTGSTGPAEDL